MICYDIGNCLASALFLALFNIIYTGWPRKNGPAYFSQYVDAITGISV